VLAFGVVSWLARPTFGSCLLGLPIILVGLATRFWASGYIGVEGRVREIGASRRLVAGPYRLLRHPLYIGNFLLVTGMLVALRPAVWLAVVVLAGFVLEYAMIAVAEERDLRQKWPSGPVVKWSSEELREAVSGRREAEGEGFSLSRAMCEWRTWVVTGVAWELAMVKAMMVWWGLSW